MVLPHSSSLAFANALHIFLSVKGKLLSTLNPNLRSQPPLLPLNHRSTSAPTPSHPTSTSVPLALFPCSASPCLLLSYLPSWACPGRGSPESLTLPGPMVGVWWMVGRQWAGEGWHLLAHPLHFLSQIFLTPPSMFLLFYLSEEDLVVS